MKENIKRTYQVEGIGKVIIKGILRAIHPFFSYYLTITFKKDISNGSSYKMGLLPNIQVKELSLTDISTLSIYFPDVNIELIKKRLKGGDKCFIAEYIGEIAAYAWVHSGDSDSIDVPEYFELAKDDFYIYDVFTHLKHRGKNIFPALLCSIMDWMKKDGFRCAYSKVFSYNKASMKSLEKVGFIKKEYVRHYNCRIIKKEFIRITKI